MEVILTSTGIGIVIIVIIQVPILFQVVMHNIQMKKYYNKMNERIRGLEDKIEKLSSE